MAFPPFLSFILLFNFHYMFARGSEFSSVTEIGTKNLQTYIVHVKRPEAGLFGQSENVNLGSWYKSFLPSRIASSDEQQQKRMLYLYKNVMTGFAARLTEEEAQAMEKMDGFVLAHPQRKFRLQTTHTPAFLGLHQEIGFWKESNFGKGVILGVLDTGVLPSHPSFSDEGMPPPQLSGKGDVTL
ncbi:hypothetical protein SLE2022_228000 [Rubroshorea leprosula]